MFNIIEKLTDAWKTRTNREDDSKIDFWVFKLTPIRVVLRKGIEKAIEGLRLGKTIDVGAGSLLYKDLLKEKGAEYYSTDLYSDHKELDYKYDIVDLGFEDNSFDTVFCNQVLEHVSETDMALSELRRVIKEDGTLVIGVPFYFYMHAMPHDYYRFTEYGLRHVLEKAGFEIESMSCYGGFFSAFIEPANIIMTAPFNKIKYLRDVMCVVNYVLFVQPPLFLDKLLKMESRFPNICIAVCKPVTKT